MEITGHGNKRMRQRLGLPKRSLERTAEKVLLVGQRREAFSGSIRRYMDKLTHKTRQYGKDPLVILHGNHIYIFTTSHVLITVLPLPAGLRRKMMGRSREAA